MSCQVIYLRWPKRHSFKQWFAIKPQLKGRNFIWDLHAVVGTWVVIFYLILACTGLYWSYDWWRNGMFKVMGVERPQAELQADARNKTVFKWSSTSSSCANARLRNVAQIPQSSAKQNTLDQAQINLDFDTGMADFPSN